VTGTALWVAGLAPALSLGGSGVALVRTRSRLSGVLLIVAAVGLVGAIVAWTTLDHATGQRLLVASIMLPGAMAVLAFPQGRAAHPFDFCAWVVIAATGVFATLDAENGTIVLVLGYCSGLVLVGILWWHFERADERDRLAILWFSVAIATSGGTLVIIGILFGPAGTFAGILGLVVAGPAMVVGVRHPRTVDVRGLIVQVCVFGVVGLTFVSLFVCVVALLEVLGVDDPPPAVLATVGLFCAATFHPLRVMLRGVIDELLFGERPDPLVAATRVADQIGDDPVLALRAIREALVLPYASLSEGGRELAASGTAVTHTRRLSLALGDDAIGEIEVGLRPGDLGLSAADEHVLRIVAPLLAQTLRARSLARELRTSRGAAIAAIEEERRRLRRDLHDGLGPTLSGIALTADAARNTMRTDPDGADELLRRLRAEATAAVGEVRRLVYDMRPPALDQLGLVPALHQQLATTRTPCGRPMQVSIDVPSDLPPLPAAVEVACYRIATEAVMNAARHSGTDRASVRIAIQDDDLTVVVSDPGVASGPWNPGVGLSSMNERAAELGGTLQIEQAPDGSIVRARLPLP
jgi:signal transduction histidine kinase